MINWKAALAPRVPNPAVPPTDEEVINILTERALAQSTYDADALARAKAEDIKRQRQEERQASAYLEREIEKKGR